MLDTASGAWAVVAISNEVAVAVGLGSGAGVLVELGDGVEVDVLIGSRVFVGEGAEGTAVGSAAAMSDLPANVAVQVKVG